MHIWSSLFLFKQAVRQDVLDGVIGEIRRSPAVKEPVIVGGFEYE